MTKEIRPDGAVEEIAEEIAEKIAEKREVALRAAIGNAWQDLIKSAAHPEFFRNETLFRLGFIAGSSWELTEGHKFLDEPKSACDRYKPEQESAFCANCGQTHFNHYDKDEESS